MSVPPGDPLPDEESEQTSDDTRSARPLVWLILLIALAAGVWYFANREQSGVEPVGPAPSRVEAVAEEPDQLDSEAPADPAPAPAAPAGKAPTPPDRPAEPVARVQPEYPLTALRAREEGTVLLRVEVDARGRPVSVEIERSSRSRELDRAARDAVLQWTFDPAIQGGQPAASTVTVPVDFRVQQQ